MPAIPTNTATSAAPAVITKATDAKQPYDRWDAAYDNQKPIAPGAAIKGVSFGSGEPSRPSYVDIYYFAQMKREAEETAKLQNQQGSKAELGERADVLSTSTAPTNSMKG